LFGSVIEVLLLFDVLLVGNQRAVLLFLLLQQAMIEPLGGIGKFNVCMLGKGF
jgi:hypothetical protein